MSTADKTYSLKKDGTDSAFCTYITFTVREDRDRAVMIKHHHDPSDPAKYSPSFHINVEGVEKIIYCNIWNHPEFAAKVWKTVKEFIFELTGNSHSTFGHIRWIQGLGSGSNGLKGKQTWHMQPK